MEIFLNMEPPSWHLCIQIIATMLYLFSKPCIIFRSERKSYLDGIHERLKGFGGDSKNSYLAKFTDERYLRLIPLESIFS